MKIYKYINYIWFPPRKHTQVLGFFQSHDHMVYSNRGPLWADHVWKSALLHKCEILEDLHQRLVPEKGDGWEITCQYMRSHATMWHSIIPSVVRARFDTHSRMTSLFLAPYSPFSEPGDGRFFKIVHGTKCLAMKQWMLHAKTSQPNNTRKDKAYQKILLKMPCQRRHQAWCGWEHRAD